MKSKIVLCGVFLLLIGILGYWLAVKYCGCEDNSQKYIESGKQFIEKSIDKIKSKF